MTTESVELNKVCDIIAWHLFFVIVGSSQFARCWMAARFVLAAPSAQRAQSCWVVCLLARFCLGCLVCPCCLVQNSTIVDPSSIVKTVEDDQQAT